MDVMLTPGLITTPARNAMEGHGLTDAALILASDAELYPGREGQSLTPRAVAYSVFCPATERFSVVTLDGRWVIPGKEGYKARGPVTSYVRKNADTLRPEGLVVLEPVRHNGRPQVGRYGGRRRGACMGHVQFATRGMGWECGSCGMLLWDEVHRYGWVIVRDGRGTHTVSYALDDSHAREFGTVPCEVPETADVVVSGAPVAASERAREEPVEPETKPGRVTVAVPGTADHMEPVTFKWGKGKTRWLVTASWRGMCFLVAYKGEFRITRNLHEDFERSPQWAAADRVGSGDGPMRTKKAVEAAMLAHVRERQAVEAEAARQIAEAEGRNAPVWESTLDKGPFKAPRRMRPEKVAELWADEGVTFEVIEEAPDESVTVEGSAPGVPVAQVQVSEALVDAETRQAESETAPVAPWQDAVPGEPVDVETPKGVVQVCYAGYDQVCRWSCYDFDDECACPPRPVMLCDGDSQPYRWEDCPECMANTLGVSAAAIRAALPGGTSNGIVVPERLALMEAPWRRAQRLAASVVLREDESLSSRARGVFRLVVGGEPYTVSTWRTDVHCAPRDGHALRADREYRYEPGCVGYSRTGDWAEILADVREHARSLGDPGDRLVLGEWVARGDRIAQVHRHEGDGVYLVRPWNWGNGNAEKVSRDQWVRCEAPEQQQTPGTQSGDARKAEGPKVSKGKGPRVGDILFTGPKGEERAELLGQTYEVEELVGEYLVHHIASGEEVCHYVKGRPAMKRAILADAVKRGERKAGAAVAARSPQPETVTLSTELETTQEQPALEYGWERYGQRFAVGDVVRSGHPRAHLDENSRKTGVVASIRERGDGEQIARVRWSGSPVGYEQWSGTLVHVPVAVLERDEEPELLALPELSEAEPVEVLDVEPVAEEALETAPEPAEERARLVTSLEGRTLDDITDPGELAELEEIAAPWPVRWLFKGERRAVNLFCGCGGWCVGLRKILGSDVDMVCVDINKDAVATSNAAGCNAICADITQLDPEHPALRYTEILIASPPCTDWSPAGKRLGHLPKNLSILTEAINRAAWAAGNYAWEETGEEYEDHPDWDPEFPPYYGPPSGESWAEVRAITDAMTAPTAKLMLEPVIWALGLWRAGAPLHTIALEQSGALPEDVRETLSSELYCAGWEHVEWEDLDAADYGSPSHRRRAFMLASRYTRRYLQQHEPIVTHASDAVGMDPDTVVITRGNRKTQGGNGFVMGRTIPGVTSKIRGWYPKDDPAKRFTLSEIARLVSLPADHPFVGSRTSASRQAADIVAPVVSAAVMGTLLGVPWLPSLTEYLAEQYPNVHGVEPEPDDDLADPVAVFIASKNSAPPRMRVLWRMTRAEAMRLCSDERSAGRRSMLCWTADPGKEGEDWEFVRDTGSYDALLAELGITPERTWEQPEKTADTAEIPGQAAAGHGGQEIAPAEPKPVAAEIPERRHAQRLQERADELTARAERMNVNASSMYGRFAGGQPILLGHHSARSALRDRERADNATRRAIEVGEQAKRLQQKAAQAKEVASLAEIEAARSRPWCRADFQPGDIVTVRDFRRDLALTSTYRVKRANTKTVTLDGGGGGWDDPKREYDRVLSRTRDGVTITDPGALLPTQEPGESEPQARRHAENSARAAAGHGVEETAPAHTEQHEDHEEGGALPYHKAGCDGRTKWLYVAAEGVARMLRHYLTCDCRGTRLGNFHRNAPAMSTGTIRNPLGIREASIGAADALADSNSYDRTGPFVIVDEVTKRAPVRWRHERRAVPAVIDPNSAAQQRTRARDAADAAACDEWANEGGAIPGVETPVGTAEIPMQAVAGPAPQEFELADMAQNQVEEMTVQEPVKETVGRRMRQARPARQKLAGARRKAARYVRETLPPAAARARATGQQIAVAVRARFEKPARTRVFYRPPVGLNEQQPPAAQPTVPEPVAEMFCAAHIARDGSQVEATTTLSLGERAWELCQEHEDRFAGFLVEALGEPGDEPQHDHEEETQDAFDDDHEHEADDEAEDAHEPDERPIEDEAQEQDVQERPSVMITGEIPGYSWDEAREAVRNAGYDIAGRAKDSTVLILCGVGAEKNASKLRDVRERGIPCMDVTRPGRFRDAVLKGEFTGGDPLPEPVKATPSGLSDREKNDRIREWGRRQGYELKDRGRLPLNVRVAYERAHEQQLQDA